LGGEPANKEAVIYLDHNATSPLRPEARDAWLEAAERFPGNPASPHRAGSRAEAALEEARQRLAARLGCAPWDLVWTSGATEACNAVLAHVAAAAPGGTVWISAIEHPAVAEAAVQLFPGRCDRIPVNAEGVVEAAWVDARLAGARPALVAVMAANNETGVLQPWAELARRCAERGVPFLCDATQWCGRLPARGLGACAYVAGSAHKFGGPRGVGFLKVPAGLPFHPLLRGGRQQDGRRAGTENVPGVLAMLAALEWAEERIAAGGHETRRAERDHFLEELTRALPGITVTGARAERLWNTVGVIMPEADCRQRWVVKLDKAGFAVSTGSACASGAERPSPVLTAMGFGSADAGRALRFSGGWATTAEDWAALREALVRIQGAMAPAGSGAP
jgi:cysteine desulfurase